MMNRPRNPLEKGAWNYNAGASKNAAWGLYPACPRVTSPVQESAWLVTGLTAALFRAPLLHFLLDKHRAGNLLIAEEAHCLSRHVVHSRFDDCVRCFVYSIMPDFFPVRDQIPVGIGRFHHVVVIPRAGICHIAEPVQLRKMILHIGFIHASGQHPVDDGRHRCPCNGRVGLDCRRT